MDIKSNSGNSATFRIFSFFDKGNLVVLGNAFQKKSQKTPKQELEKAIKIMGDILNKNTDTYAQQIKKKNSVRVNFRDIGINVRILFYAPVFDLPDIKSKITFEIYEKLKKEKNINFAGPTGTGILKK